MPGCNDLPLAVLTVLGATRVTNLSRMTTTRFSACHFSQNITQWKFYTIWHKLAGYSLEMPLRSSKFHFGKFFFEKIRKCRKLCQIHHVSFQMNSISMREPKLGSVWATRSTFDIFPICPKRKFTFHNRPFSLQQRLAMAVAHPMPSNCC